MKQLLTCARLLCEEWLWVFRKIF